MAKKKPSAEVPSVANKPTMYLDGAHARSFKSKPVGSTVRVVVHGKVVGQSADSYGGEGPQHSTRIEISKVRPVTRRRTRP